MSADLPWVLLRKGKPVIRFAERELGQRFFDRQRYNAGAQPDAALVGPEAEAWYCAGTRWGQWVRDDERRRRAVAEEDEGVA